MGHTFCPGEGNMSWGVMPRGRCPGGDVLKPLSTLALLHCLQQDFCIVICFCKFHSITMIIEMIKSNFYKVTTSLNWFCYHGNQVIFLRISHFSHFRHIQNKISFHILNTTWNIQIIYWQNHHSCPMLSSRIETFHLNITGRGHPKVNGQMQRSQKNHKMTNLQNLGKLYKTLCKMLHYYHWEPLESVMKT